MRAEPFPVWLRITAVPVTAIAVLALLALINIIAVGQPALGYLLVLTKAVCLPFAFVAAGYSMRLHRREERGR